MLAHVVDVNGPQRYVRSIMFDDLKE